MPVTSRPLPASLALLAFAAACWAPPARAQAPDTACPGSKFRGVGVCEALEAVAAEEFLRFDIGLAPVAYDSGKDYSLARIRERAEDLFTRFDLRHRHDTAQRLPVPSDPTANESYRQIQMRKRTALELAREAYVERLDLVPGYGGFCPGPKIGNPALCAVLQAKGDSGYLLVRISLRPSMPGSEGLPEEVARLRAEAESLYAGFDLRDARDTARRAAAPAGPQADWYHGPFLAIGRTVAALAESPIVHWLTLGQSDGPAVTARRPVRGPRPGGASRAGRGGGVDALGRHPGRPGSRSTPPTPRLP